MRHLIDDVDGVLRGNRVLICDRDRKWSAAVERFLATGGVRLIRTPFMAPNCNAHAERFVRSIKEACLNRVIPLGDLQIGRQLTDATYGVLGGPCILICDRDRKWSTGVRQLLETSGVRGIRTPYRTPNCNAPAERFVRSIKRNA